MNNSERVVLNDDILLRVQKPGRYIGNEVNAAVKDEADVGFILCYPDVYEVGMSCLGLQLLYFFLNRREDTRCERAFAPWPDMEGVMRSRGVPLFALESREPVVNFDFLGFTLQYEMTYANVINILELAGIPPYARERGENFPIICAGGPCAVNPEPLAELMDFFYIGDGEQCLDEIIEIYRRCASERKHKREFLQKIAAVAGVYVPSLYDVAYDEAGLIKSFTPNDAAAPELIGRTFVRDLDSAFFPDRLIVPNIETVHDRASIELFRGCARGCRFCQAGHVHRPVRERGLATLLTQAGLLLKNTGYDELSLVSLSASDYSRINELTETLAERCAESNVNISLPSVRVDATGAEVMERLRRLRKGSVTFAPEAGSQELRDRINKRLTEKEIIDGCAYAVEAGVTRIKLYFMVGLPGETDGDLIAIAELCDRIASMAKKGRADVSVSGGCFVPKPFTPFQWEAQDDAETFTRKHRLIKSKLRNRRIKYNYQEGPLARVEAALARGDRRVLRPIIRAHELGARFDGWTDFFDYGLWERAFAETGAPLDFYASRKRGEGERLPWDHILCGVMKAHLLNERRKSLRAEVSPNCYEECMLCGAEGVCHG